jgi:alpha-1,2-mannosyltransferase
VNSRAPATRLLLAGAAVFLVALGGYLFYALTHSAIYTQDPVDLKVYVDGGRIARHISPYNPHKTYPLYDWGGYSSLNLKFTYTPFAAVAFALASFVPGKINPHTGLPFIVPDLSVAVNIVLFVLALWFTFGGLGYRDRRVRAGATLLVAGLTLWMQPVLRTMYLGQVNLLLMALILWDLCQPKGRWWKGIGTGVAAGIKLIPLVFVPYLLLARRFREAAGVIIGFVATIGIGFLVLPKDSVKWWIDGLVIQGSGKRAGFPAWEGNQSLQGIIDRLSGSIAAGNHAWLVSAAVVLILGVSAAAVLDRAGYRVPAILTASLTGLLVSPISWDHHWVWVAPAVAVFGHYAVRFWRAGRAGQAGQAGRAVPAARAKAMGCFFAAAVLLAMFAAWPAAWFEKARYLGSFSLGLLWMQPDTDPSRYLKDGDQPWFYEYHWHGFQLLWGNAYVLTGMAMFVLMLVISLRTWASHRGQPVTVSSEEAACVPAPHSAPTT